MFTKGLLKIFKLCRNPILIFAKSRFMLKLIHYNLKNESHKNHIAFRNS